VVSLVVAAGLAPWLFASSTRPDGSRSNQLLDGGFDGNSLDSAFWNTCYWWGCTIPSNGELQWYERSQVSVADGLLHLTAEALPVEIADGDRLSYRSGMISSGPSEQGGKPKFAFTYGTVEARLRVPAGKGLWSALWMLPAFGDSRPEVDIVEVLGSDTRTSYQTLHRRDRNSKAIQHSERGSDLADGWHVYRLEWLPEKLRWYVDGKLVFTVKGDEVPDKPMYIMANLAVGGRWPGSPNESTRFPASMLIDYIDIRPGVGS
jgi:beta-glucanase (GH16 family)